MASHITNIEPRNDSIKRNNPADPLARAFLAFSRCSCYRRTSRSGAMLHLAKPRISNTTNNALLLFAIERTNRQNKENGARVAQQSAKRGYAPPHRSKGTSSEGACQVRRGNHTAVRSRLQLLAASLLPFKEARPPADPISFGNGQREERSCPDGCTEIPEWSSEHLRSSRRLRRTSPGAKDDDSSESR